MIRLFFFLVLQLALLSHAQVTINEVMVKPGPDATNSAFQSLKMCSSSTSGSEYIELYNADPCNPVDVSCYIIGFNIFTSQSHGTFRFPAGSVIPPLGFLSIGGPNSGATLNLFTFCSTPNLNTGNDRWYLENGDGYVILYNTTGTLVDAVYWTFSSGQASKWGTDPDIFDAPTLIAAGVGCPVVSSLAGPSSIPIGNAEYAGAAPALGLVVHRTTDGGPVWSNTGTPTVNNCNGVCNTGGSSNTISYSGNPFCTTTASVPVSLSGTSGGTFTSTTGLTINAITGTISPSGSTPGTYTVTYTQGGCATTTSVTITAQPFATIDYAGSPYCTTTGSGIVTLTGTSGGVFSSAPGISIDPVTGAISPGTSSPGIYTVTYTIAAGGGCPLTTATTTVSIIDAPTATISYANNPLCATSTNELVTFLGAGGGLFSSTAGLSINTSTGAINPSASTPGTYTVTYTSPSNPPCAPVTATTVVTITNSPTATISYSGSPFCSTTTSGPVSLSGSTGGTFSSSAGLSIDATTGTINPAASVPGTYTITYTIAPNPPCAGFTTTTSALIVAAPTASINYLGNPFCTTLNSAAVSLTGTPGGTFSSSSGLTLNPTTGEINPGTSTPGTYTITYSIPASGNCSSVSSTTTVTITSGPTASIGYPNAPYCTSETNGSPSISGSSGGTFSSAGGISLNAVTGTINPSLSTPGTYSIIYSIPASGGCPSFADTAIVIINPTPIAGAGNPVAIVLGSSTLLSASGGGSYQWTPSATLSCDTCSITTATPSTTTDYCVTVTTNGCSDTACVRVIVDITCGEIFVPTAFSPNGDQQNDIIKVYGNCIVELYFAIFNRWGEKVFETTDPNESWDGTLRDKSVNNAVFHYYLSATLITGEIVERSGNISLIK